MTALADLILLSAQYQAQLAYDATKGVAKADTKTNRTKWFLSRGRTFVLLSVFQAKQAVAATKA